MIHSAHGLLGIGTNWVGEDLRSPAITQGQKLSTTGESPMTLSPTAKRLANAIESSGLTHREIADRMGYRNTLVITKMIDGILPVSLGDAAALSRILGLDPNDFLLLAIDEYHLEVPAILSEALGLGIANAKRGLVVMFRMDAIGKDPELATAFAHALDNLLKISDAAISR